MNPGCCVGRRGERRITWSFQDSMSFDSGVRIPYYLKPFNYRQKNLLHLLQYLEVRKAMAGWKAERHAQF